MDVTAQKAASPETSLSLSDLKPAQTSCCHKNMTIVCHTVVV